MSVWVRKHEPYTESPNSPRPRKEREREKSKVKSMLIIFFISRRLFTKNSSRQAKQPIPHTIVTFYSDCVKMCEDFSPNFDDKWTGC
jgi:hypothetical protein